MKFLDFASLRAIIKIMSDDSIYNLRASNVTILLTRQICDGHTLKRNENKMHAHRLKKLSPLDLF